MDPVNSNRNTNSPALTPKRTNPQSIQRPSDYQPPLSSSRVQPGVYGRPTASSANYSSNRYQSSASPRSIFSEFNSRAENLVRDLATGARVFQPAPVGSRANKVLNDLNDLVGNANSARQIVEAAESTGLKVPESFGGLGARSLSRAARFLDGVTGARDFLGEFSREYDAGSQLYPRTMLRGAFSVGQTVLGAGAGTYAGAAAMGVAGAAVAAVGLTGMAAATLTLGAGVAVGAATAYGIGTAATSLRGAVESWAFSGS